MKKLVFSAGVFTILFSSNAFGACTAEEFQKEVLAMQAAMVELAKNPEKLAIVNTGIEKEFGAEVLGFSQLAQGAAGNAEKTQQMLDKGCDLYGRMNKYLNEKK